MLGSKSSNTGKPMLYSYQGALPSLPVPPIKQTLDRYIIYAIEELPMYDIIQILYQ